MTALREWSDDDEKEGDIANLTELLHDAGLSPARAERLARAAVRLADEEAA